MTDINVLELEYFEYGSLTAGGRDLGDWGADRIAGGRRGRSVTWQIAFKTQSILNYEAAPTISNVRTVESKIRDA